MAQTNILALDLGTTTGWAGRFDGRILSGTQSFKPGRYEGGGMRFLRFRRWLNEVQSAAVEIHEVKFEEVRRHRGTDAAHVYGGLLAVLTEWCEQNKIPYAGYPVGSIKKFATGSGNAGKDEMIESAIRAGFNPTDDNEADAIHILRMAIAEADQ